MPAAHEIYETLITSQEKQKHFLEVAAASAYENEGPARHIDDEVPGAICVRRTAYPYSEMQRNFENMETHVMKKSVPICFSWIKDMVGDSTSEAQRLKLIDRVLKNIKLAGASLNISIVRLIKTKDPFSSPMYAKLGQHDKTLVFTSPESFLFEINTPDAMCLQVGINEDHEAAFFRLYRRDKTGSVHERLLIFNEVSRILYKLEDTRTFSEEYSTDMETKLKLFETLVETHVNESKSVSQERKERNIYKEINAKKDLMKTTKCPISSTEALPSGCHETVFTLYKRFSDMRHAPIAQYEIRHGSENPGKNATKSDRTVISNNLIVDAYTQYSALFARDVSKLNYVYACLRSVAVALVRHFEGYVENETDNAASKFFKKLSWDELNETVEQYIENFETLKPSSTPTEQNILRTHLFNVATMADFVTILFQKAFHKTSDEESVKLLKPLLGSGLNYTNNIKAHFGHILLCHFFHVSPLQVITKPEKPGATNDEKIKFTETQKVTITNVTEQIKHDWKPLYVEFNTRAYVKSYRRYVTDVLKEIFNQGKYNAKTEQKKFTRKVNTGSISVMVDTRHFVQTTIQQPYQILHGTTIVVKNKPLPSTTAPEVKPQQSSATSAQAAP